MRIRREDERYVALKQFVSDGKRIFGVKLDIEYGGINLIGGYKGERFISYRQGAKHKCSGLLKILPHIEFQRGLLLNNEDILAYKTGSHNLFLLGTLTQATTGS